MNNLIYLIHCESCNWKKVFKEEKEIEIENLYEIKKPDIQKNIAKIEDGVLIKETYKKQKKFFRCLQCGKHCFVRTIPDAQKNMLDKIELEKSKKQREIDEKNWTGGNKNSFKR